MRDDSWTPIDVEIPPEDETVIVRTWGGDILCAQASPVWDEEKKEWMKDPLFWRCDTITGEIGCFLPVTHWRRFPEGPQVIDGPLPPHAWKSLLDWMKR